mmetsp:Transcript_41122/g.130664  ORF Transcript_41122/g.130664 Transcript_41122/m.130664 type:complete len:210 (+) Transcript_41122:3235-3864(+)
MKRTEATPPMVRRGAYGSTGRWSSSRRPCAPHRAPHQTPLAEPWMCPGAPPRAGQTVPCVSQAPTIVPASWAARPAIGLLVAGPTSATSAVTWRAGTQTCPYAGPRVRGPTTSSSSSTRRTAAFALRMPLSASAVSSASSTKRAEGALAATSAGCYLAPTRRSLHRPPGQWLTAASGMFLGATGTRCRFASRPSLCRPLMPATKRRSLA